MKKAPTTLIIMDGYGLSDKIQGNAVKAANTPVLDRLFAEYPHTSLSASGLDVGLPDGQMGNSEVGHTNIGGGRVVFQDLPRISRAIDDGTFFENPAYNAAMDACLEKGTALHLMGLHSDGGVHSTLEHLYALLKMASIKGLKRVYIHCFLDGRDVSPTSGKDFVAQTVKKCAELGVGKVATVMGRFYAMDRDKRWDRVEAAYDAIVYGEGIQNPDPVAAIKESYENGVTDEFVEPVVCDKSGMVGDNDSIIFFNYRPDRAREITRAFVDPEFDGFKRERFPVTYVCNTEYDATMPNVLVAFPRLAVKNNLGEYLSSMCMTQLRIAETEKYAHVTFFFNGGVEKQYEGEDRVLVPSPKVATYDLQPEMSAPEVTDKCVERILSGNYDVVILNFANCDMVGHTGVFDAAVKAVETVDTCVGRVVDATLKMGGIAMITADHGNCEQMLQDDGVSPMTAHTTNLVPFILCGAGSELRPGRLADIAPTILDVLGLEQPADMDGKTLIVK
jgi:2,3-bisphosphoglycerate-independent phosphoglycerate mutase